jgi:hypothetical protein
MKKSGSVTVFLSLVFVCVSALVCALVESARTAGTRYYLQNMADSAIDSVFSEYNRELWDAYRLILLESGDEEKTRQDFEAFMKPYAENSGWYRTGAPAAEITDVRTVTDDGGAWFEQEVRDYLQYGWISLDQTPDSAEKLWKKITEAAAMNAITRAYGLRSQEAVRMEKAVAAVSRNLQEQEGLRSSAHADLLSGSNDSFQQAAAGLEKKVRALPGLIADYDARADAFGKHLDEVQSAHEADFQKLEEENRRALEEQIASYRAYTAQDGERRTVLDALDDNAENTLNNIANVRMLADDTEQAIEDAKNDPDANVDEDGLWREVADAWDTVKVPAFAGAFGVRDEKKEKLLESVADLAEDGFLNLVLPAGRNASETEFDLSAFPSRTAVTARTDGGPSLLTSLAVGEYAGKFLPNFTDNSSRPIACQLEYVVTGSESDRDNLSGALLRILAVREGLNYLSIMADSGKRDQARALAIEIAGSAALPALAGLLECLIIAAWAGAESLMDLKALLSGKKIALVKSAEDWMLSLPDVLLIAAERRLPDARIRESKFGISYESYLKLLLFVRTAEERNYRIMDMIQAGMREKERTFLMQNCIYGMQATVTCDARHLFTSLILSSGGSPRISPEYTVTAQTVKAY